VNDKVHEWTAEMVKQFNKLHRQQPPLSFARIAAEMSAAFDIELTRNACIGKARRLGFPMRSNEGIPRKGGEKPRMIKIRVDAPIPPKPARRQINGTFNLTIYETREGDCKWPLGEVEDYPPYLYCGHPTPIGCPFCKTHSRMAYNSPSKTWS
jgi:hypothetical protein